VKAPRSLRIVPVVAVVAAAVLSLLASPAAAQDGGCAALGLGRSTAEVHAALTKALKSVAPNKEANGGLGNNMWGTLVDGDGRVCAVTFTGANRASQWGASRVISAQKANTAASLNLPPGVGGTVDALSTANLWAPTQPGGSLWELPFSNPVDPQTAYGKAADIPKYGTPQDPMVGQAVGGVNVFGGGLALYDAKGNKVGAVGVSGDSSCADHNIAWKLRHALNLDYLTTAKVRGLSPAPRQDNILYDIADGKSKSGFGHPVCGFKENAVELPPTR
jgi:hypothetical protein